MPPHHTPGFLAIVEDAKSRVRETTTDAYAALRDSGAPHILIDVREESEWAAGHAEGAVHLGKGVIERDIETRVPDHGAHLILYCGGGYRSALAADALQKMGYTNVESLAGGWRAWNEAKLPAVTG
ncbi:MAG: sulfurtransferase [Acidobacteria bacterium]|nr:sulfurtransferase [Acidobacteriota bacterium]